MKLFKGKILSKFQKGISKAKAKVDAKIDPLKDKVNKKLDPLKDKVNKKLDPIKDKADILRGKIDKKLNPITDVYQHNLAKVGIRDAQDVWNLTKKAIFINQYLAMNLLFLVNFVGISYRLYPATLTEEEAIAKHIKLPNRKIGIKILDTFYKKIWKHVSGDEGMDKLKTRIQKGAKRKITRTQKQYKYPTGFEEAAVAVLEALKQASMIISPLLTAFKALGLDKKIYDKTKAAQLDAMNQDADSETVPDLVPTISDDEQRQNMINAINESTEMSDEEKQAAIAQINESDPFQFGEELIDSENGFTMPVWGWITIGVVALGITGTIIYFATRKKK